MNDRNHTTLRSAFAALYNSPLDDFIRSRDALAKELRAAGNREAASSVKGLRKPSRSAWALNRAVYQSPEALEALEAAVAGINDAHAGSGDLRSAMATLRGSIREFAKAAAAESHVAGFSLDIGELSNAVLAVLGNPSSYDQFRSGQLTEIPDAGGLDFLASLPARPKLEVSESRPPSSRIVDPAVAAAAREQARLASEALDTAHGVVEAAAATLSEAEADVSAAQEKARIAESELKAAQQRHEFARRARDSASAELRKAEVANKEAQRRLQEVTLP